PYCDICVIGFTSQQEILTKAAANEVITKLKNATESKYKDEKIIVLGPVPARVSRIGGKFRYRIIIKCKNTKSFRNMTSEILKDMGNDKRFRAVTVYADINPDSML
ncbi:MAG: primosomal protein N', partial [Clostridia bacterium]|nr:primosomal protein N' [Clostridia bacterium]